MRPVLIINGNDYTEYVEDLTPTDNGLNADGSGRDVQNGLMFRKKITDKQSWVVKMLDLPEDVVMRLRAAIRADYYSATVLDPNENKHVTKTFYTDSVPYGAQIYQRSSGKTIYRGMQFSMIER